MEKTVLVSVLISLITGMGGWLAAREARKANTTNTLASNRVEMEKEAYERARALDTETINRQSKQIQELLDNQEHLNRDVKLEHEENERLHQEHMRMLEEGERLRMELAQLRRRFTLYQRGLPEDTTAPIREREGDTNPMMERFNNGRD